MNKADTNNNKKVESCTDSTDSAKTSSTKDSEKVPIEQSASKDDQNANNIDAVVIDQERKPSNMLQQQQQHIPNVFEDDIFDFLDSIKNSSNKTGSLNKTNVQNELNNGLEKSRALETGAIPKNSWRNSSNGNTQTAHIEQWRQNTNKATSKSTNQVQVPNTQSIIQNGAIYTGIGIRPCPTYELNNMYLKFPHLNSEKVPNPLKPSQSHKTRLNVTNNAQNISNRIDKVNAKGDISSCQRNNLSSLLASNKNLLAHRGRSSSSIDIRGVSKSSVSPQQRNDQKLSSQQKIQSKDDKRSGGAIPKQLNRNGIQSNNSKPPNSLDEVLESPIDTKKLESKNF